MPVASLLDPLVNLSTDFIDSAGLPGVFVLMALGSANIPVPSEVVMLFAGFNVSDGKMSMLGIIVAGVAGNMVGSWVSYALGYFGRVELIERNKLIHLGPKQIAQADGWFKRYGDAAVFFTRLLPVVRAFISLPAGLARMPFWRFSVLTFLGSAPWVIGARVPRTGGGPEMGRVAPAARLPRLRRRRRGRGARRLRRDQVATRPPRGRAGARTRAGLGVGALSDPIPARRAIALGIVQGPAELLPVSSSAHLNLVPWLAGWNWDRHDPELRKSFEVALHAGAAGALLVGQRKVIAEELREFDLRRAAVLALSFAPPAIAGYTLERPIERRLGGPGATAAGLLAGAAAMILADRRPQERGRGSAGPIDGLALGLAQAAALAPGVSRNGATLAAARWRRFTREHANMLSRTVALPVIVGAALFKGVRLRGRGDDPALRRSMAAGIGASFASTLASQSLIKQVERDRALWPYAAYRAALAGVVLWRLRRARRPPPAVSAEVVASGNGRPVPVPSAVRR